MREKESFFLHDELSLELPKLASVNTRHRFRAVTARATSRFYSKRSESLDVSGVCQETTPSSLDCRRPVETIKSPEAAESPRIDNASSLRRAIVVIQTLVISIKSRCEILIIKNYSDSYNFIYVYITWNYY